MVNITVTPNCENSPKMELLRDFTIAFAEGKRDFILDNMADDIRWEMVGTGVTNGHAAANTQVTEMLDGSTTDLTITTIVTHGDAGAVNGIMTFKDGTTFAYADFYTFTSHAKDAKIKTLTSYVVDVSSSKKS